MNKSGVRLLGVGVWRGLSTRERFSRESDLESRGLIVRATCPSLLPPTLGSRTHELGLAAAVLALTMLAGCIVTTLHAIYTEKDLVFDPALLGSWVQTGADDVLQFSQADPKSYRLVHTDGEGKTGTFTARLARIQGNLFLDLYPQDPSLANNGFFSLHLLPAHSFLYVSQTAPSLKVSLMKLDWLKEHLKANPDAIRHEVLDDGRVVLTAPTAEIQAFAVKHLKTPGAYSESSTFWKATRADKKQ